MLPVNCHVTLHLEMFTHLDSFVCIIEKLWRWNSQFNEVKHFYYYP